MRVGCLSHTRDVLCYLSDRRLVYSIPLFFPHEKNFFGSSFLEVEIDKVAPPQFILTKGDLKSYIIQQGIEPLTNQEKYLGCCEKK
jgi:hypothetical protein